MIGRIQMAKARRAYRKQSEVKRRCSMYLEAARRHAAERKATDITWYGPLTRITAAERTP